MSYNYTKDLPDPVNIEHTASYNLIKSNLSPLCETDSLEILVCPVSRTTTVRVKIYEGDIITPVFRVVSDDYFIKADLSMKTVGDRISVKFTYDSTPDELSDAWRVYGEE